MTVTENTQHNSAEPDSDSAELTDRDRDILAEVDSSLANALQLKAWWERTSANDSFANRFPTALTLNRPDRSFAFFDHAEVDGEKAPILGDMQDLFYDNVKGPPLPKVEIKNLAWTRGQLREFILHYFTRVSSTYLPDFFEPGAPSPPPFLNPFGLCPGDGVEKEGFGQRQLYYKLRESGKVGKFPKSEQFAVIDLREIGTKYEWIIGDAEMFGFNVSFKPLGSHLPYGEIPLREKQLALITRDFITDRELPLDSAGDRDIVGEFGYGLATLKRPRNVTPFGWGPGFFDMGFMTYTWRLHGDGEIRAKMVFVVNQPEFIVNPALSPMAWGWKLADAASMGIAGNLLNRLPLAVRSALVDPVFGSIAAANIATLGQADRRLCISRTDVNKLFLFYHYIAIYTLVVNSLATWRLVPDWLDKSAIPAWVPK